MFGRWLFGLVLLQWAWAAGFPAIAKECGPLKMVASITLVPQAPNREMVPVAINRSQRLFLLDTGGGYSQISPSTARALWLSKQTGASPLFDLSGNVSTDYVKIDKFAFGGIAVDDAYLRIAPNDVVDGIIGPDLLNRFDVEMDFANQKLNYFLPDHCPGKVVYWPHGDVAQIPIELANKRSIKVPVKLDGQSLLATIDTGAERTTITWKTARDSFGLAADSPGMKRVGTVNGDPYMVSYQHTFSGLALEGVTIQNPRIQIIPDKVADAGVGSGMGPYASGAYLPVRKPPRSPELLLGMDVLKHLHLYFAFREENLYVSAAEPPAALAATATNQGCDMRLKPVMATLRTPDLRPGRVGQDFQGTVILQVLVNMDGVPVSAAVATSSGAPLMDQAAVDFIKAHWRWEPFSPDCRSASISTKVTMSWKPQRAEAPPPVDQSKADSGSL